jgi:uncharacterized membrane protein
MRSPASFKGHPIHPMLVPLPIGLWMFALVADVVTWSGRGGETWAAAARIAVAVGVAGALVAALPGLIDLLSLKDPPVRKLGLWHMALNLAAVAVFTWNFWVRWQAAPASEPPLLLTVLGVALIGVSGWLGGEMVYVHGVAVEHAPSPPEARPR